MTFVEFCISKGYKPFRKIFDTKQKRWTYIEENDKRFDYFSSVVPGYMDIRLFKNEQEIVYGLYYAKDGKTHPPMLIYPNPYNVHSKNNKFQFKNVDDAFYNLSFSEILDDIELEFNDINNKYKGEHC